MCCFSGSVEEVSGTQIFARPTDKGRQLVVYSMRFAAKEDLAMILPIPTPKDAAEDAVRFISLQEYPEFFNGLERGFPARTKGFGVEQGIKHDTGSVLKVVEVGKFEASFVPSVADFERLDSRFRLPAGTWEKLPGYKASGFVVFKLKAGEMKVHPMAFEFPRQDPKKFFFPTIHIHDGQIHERAKFDHLLYLQRDPADMRMLDGWSESSQPPEHFMDVEKTAGIVVANRHVYRKGIRGQLPNADTYV